MKRDPEYYDSIEDYTADVIAAREAYAADRAVADARPRGASEVPRGRASITLNVVIRNEFWMSANDRMHWAQKAKRTRVLRQYGCVTGTRADTPTLGTSHVAAFIGYPRNGKADPANAAPTVKALIDGLVDAGVWPDDDSTYVLGPTYLRGEKCPAGQHTVRFVITSQEIPF